VVCCALKKAQLTIIFSQENTRNKLINSVLIIFSSRIPESMNRNFILLFGFIYFLNIPLANAQPGVLMSPNDLMVTVDEEFVIEIHTDSFINMISTSFSLNWDHTVIEFDTFQINLTPQQLFWNDLSTDEGRFSLIWNNTFTPNPSFEDGTNILTIKFKAISNGKSCLEFSDTPTVAFSISNPDNDGEIEQPLKIIQNGTICVGGNCTCTTAITTPGLEQPSLVVKQNTPNPFKEYTLIPFELTKSEYITLNILDFDGKSIFQYSNQYDEGTHSIRLEKEVFTHDGIYLYQIKTANSLITNKLILVK